MQNVAIVEDNLIAELSQLIEQSQHRVISQTNHTVTILFWDIGNRVNKNILNFQRVDYAKAIVSTVSIQLKMQYGRNFELRNLRQMMQFAEQFTDIDILILLTKSLSWSHFIELLPLKNPEAKLFYAQLSVTDGLGIRDLRKRISTKTFERTSIANLQNTDSYLGINNNFTGPYFLDFLGLQNTFLERIWKLLF